MSAEILRQWLAPGPRTARYLKGHNDFDLVQCVTASGTKYLLKTQTGNFKRLHNKLYYDHTFVNLLFTAMLKNSGKSEPTFLEITRRFIAQGCPCALLGLRNRLTRRRLMEEVWALDAATSLRKTLIDHCTDHGEWTVLSHDATFKSLFAVLGQEKMAQKQGELHTVHSILGKSGALPGLAALHTEGKACFQQACVTLLPQAARNTTQWIFSDTPHSVLNAALENQELFPNLLGVAEDPLHFVFRVEACFAERRTPLSRMCLRIQKKFSAPCPGAVYVPSEENYPDTQGHGEYRGGFSAVFLMTMAQRDTWLLFYRYLTFAKLVLELR